MPAQSRYRPLQTMAYEALLAAGDAGLSIDEVMAVVTPEEHAGAPRPVDRGHAVRTVGKLVESGGAELVGPGRWRALPDWVMPPRTNPKFDILSKCKDPVVGEDCTQEEFDAMRAARGRKKKNKQEPDEPVMLTAEQVAVLDPEEQRRYRLYLVKHFEGDWRRWVPSMFPAMAAKPFAPHHEEFWDHVDQVELGQPLDPLVCVWGRGAGKSANLEMAVARWACLNRRKYVLYVGSTQTLADEHVESIASLLQSEMVQLAYPAVANPEIGKHGQARAWRRSRLRTASGFTLDALGLDVAARGKRIDEQRPDGIVFDDLDDTDDTPATTAKKIRAITRKIMPTMAQDVAVVGVQNLVHPESIFARLVSRGGPTEPPPADFLAGRVVSGPVPAVRGLEYEQHTNSDGRVRWLITGGEPTWEGMPLESCQHEIDTFGIDAFLAECQHEEPDWQGSMFGHLDFSNDGPIRVSAMELERVGVLRTCVWVDPAISKTDKSDSCGVVCHSLGKDRRYYVRAAWERIASPTEALTQAIRYALEFEAEIVGVETDQGGATWETIYQRVLPEVVQSWVTSNEGEMPPRIPRYDSRKAGSTQMSKIDRAQRMRAEYDLGRVRHVEGHATALERGLRRFPERKPYDVVDAAVWGCRYLGEHGGDLRQGGGVRARRPRGAVASVSSSALA